MSYLPQEASVFRKLTVEDNIRAILELQYDKTGARLSRTEIEKRLNNLLDELQIQHIRTNTALSLSGGERRRTEIARALQLILASFCSTNRLQVSTQSP